MSSASERIWFGTSPEADVPGDVRGVLWPLALFVALVAIRLALPFTANPSMEVYRQIAAAVLNEENWGRQALVATLNYPPLPAVCLLLLSPLRGWLDPGHLMVAITQVWTFVYLVRLANIYPSRKLRWFFGTLFLVVLLAGPAAAEANPFWIHLVVFGSILFHLCRWERYHALRDLVVLSLNCGLMVFTGFLGIAVGLTVLVTVWLRGDPRFIRRNGGTTLLFLPFIYAALLYPLFNWLIMGRGFFFIQHFVDGFAHSPLLANIQSADSFDLEYLVILAMIAVVLMAFPKVPLYLRVGANLVCVATACAVLRHGAEIYLGGEHLMFGFIEIPLLLFFLYHDQSELKSVLAVVALMAVSLVLIAACVQFRGSAKTNETFAHNPPPPQPAELVELVDEYWARSRILIYDLRTAVIYAHSGPAASRFLPRLDFDEEELRKLIRKEQFHLLIPPNNGRFYSRTNSPLADIHEHGRRWLLLERQWPGGWQLWRCIRPRPED